MLIVFDLDDTLIQTTFEVTPFKLELLVDALKHEGFKANNSEVLDLKRINLGAEGSESALIEFFELYPHRRSFLFQALQLFKSQEALPPGDSCYQEVTSIIEGLSFDHTLALVTKGKTSFQNKKIHTYKLPLSCFSDIHIVEKGSKYHAYLEIQRKFGFHSADVVVIGDRVEADLIPAKRLGFSTIHIKAGRGSSRGNRKDDIIDYQICSLSELSGIIQDIQIKNFLRVL